MNTVKDMSIEAMKDELKRLPQGNPTYRTIRGKKRMYLQWTENGRRMSRYIKAAEESEVLEAIERRESIKEALRLYEMECRLSVYSKLRGITYDSSESSSGDQDRNQVNKIEDYTYTNAKFDTASKVAEPLTAYIANPPVWETNVITGAALRSMTEDVRELDRRECMKDLQFYFNNRFAGKVCILYGLRRTGKTTLMMQAIRDLPEESTAYIRVDSHNTIDELNRDMRELANRGFKYVFIDEVTLMEDFIGSAAILSDIYAMMNMKVVLSGTDSLGFDFAAKNELFDRAFVIHTTFIPFREYAHLMGSDDIDEYIRNGGILHDCRGKTQAGNDHEGSDYNDGFFRDEFTREYIDTSIALNIQHSLKHYKFGSRFMYLRDLYGNNELTSAINRVIEDMNHDFTVETLTENWKSHDLGSARELMRKRALNGENSRAINSLNKIDIKSVTDRTRQALKILNKPEMKVEITEDAVLDIKLYLSRLDLIENCPTETMDRSMPIERIIFTQPGMRFCQARILIDELLKDPAFKDLNEQEKNEVREVIVNDVSGRMLEDIVLYETKLSLPGSRRAFKLFMDEGDLCGEIDMVVLNTEDYTCELYEVKHSSRQSAEQYRHLTDENIIRYIEKRFGAITKKTVLYRGEDCTLDNGINYINVEKYLKAL